MEFPQSRFSGSRPGCINANSSGRHWFPAPMIQAWRMVTIGAGRRGRLLRDIRYSAFRVARGNTSRENCLRGSCFILSGRDSGGGGDQMSDFPGMRDQESWLKAVSAVVVFIRLTRKCFSSGWRPRRRGPGPPCRDRLLPLRRARRRGIAGCIRKDLKLRLFRLLNGRRTNYLGPNHASLDPAQSAASQF
ncbi:MAG: hypothetical protein JWP20_1668 [Roseomonas sp.]|nr:hypothetical protein [Roseomonas sp.]